MKAKMKKFKVSFGDPTYRPVIVTKPCDDSAKDAVRPSHVTVCEIPYSCNHPLFDGVVFTATGVAQCSQKDAYDEKTGRQIARTKAEIKARKAIIDELYRYANELERLVKDADNLSDRLVNDNAHDWEFIESFS